MRGGSSVHYLMFGPFTIWKYLFEEVYISIHKNPLILHLSSIFGGHCFCMNCKTQCYSTVDRQLFIQMFDYYFAVKIPLLPRTTLCPSRMHWYIIFAKEWEAYTHFAGGNAYRCLITYAFVNEWGHKIKVTL